MGQQLCQRIAYVSVVPSDAQDLQIRCKFTQKLSAGTAGCAVTGAVCIYRKPLPASFPLADGGAGGYSLGADASAKSGVFHIAAGDHRSVVTFQRRAYGKAGVGSIGVCR